ncbi:MAG: ABC transporter permease [Desulfobulbus sp.]|nr:ABC transporter permease [Desulfobulbus sp.]
MADSLDISRRCRRWLARQRRLIGFAALALVAVLSPSCYDRRNGRALAAVFCLGAWQMLPGYLLTSILVGTVLTRIIAVTSASYGLSHLALEAVIRVLALELTPLVAALFVALRLVPITMQQLARPPGALPPSYRQLLPYVAGGAGAVLALAVFGGISLLVVAYLVVHGLSQWALAGYARLIGEVFDPATALVFTVKLLLFAGIVGLAPTTIVIEGGPSDPAARQMRVMARLLALLIVSEAALLVLPRL